MYIRLRHMAHLFSVWLGSCRIWQESIPR